MFPTLLSSAVMQLEKDAIAHSIAKQQARLANPANRAADTRRRRREPRTRR
jgi:hypothetical protein